MITTLLLIGFFGLINLVMSVFPNITSFPFGTDAFIKACLQALNALRTVLWPLSPVIAAMFVWINVKIWLLVVKLFMGHRAPIHVDHTA